MPRTKHKPAQPIAVDRKLSEAGAILRTAITTLQTAAAATQAPKPELVQSATPELEARKARLAEAERQLEALREFFRTFSDMSVVDFALLKTFKTILDRDHGCTSPVEQFISHVVFRYQNRDDDGQGLTVEDIKEEMEEDLRGSDLAEEIERAHFMASRYPRAEPEKADTASNS